MAAGPDQWAMAAPWEDRVWHALETSAAQHNARTECVEQRAGVMGRAIGIQELAGGYALV